MDNLLTWFKNHRFKDLKNDYGYIIKADKTIEPILTKPTFEEIKKMIGGYVEIVYYIEDEQYEVVVDESGLVKDKPFNLGAFAITGHYLYGDVLVIKKGVIT